MGKSSKTVSATKDQIQRRSIVTRLLKIGMERKRLSNPGYSRQALARDLGVSGAFVTNLFSGKKELPRDRATKISRILELDVHEKKMLFEAILSASAIEGFESGPRSAGKESILKSREVLKGADPDLLAHWYNLAVLEGLTLTEPLNSIESLKERLRLSQKQMELALRTLETTGVVEARDGHYKKRTDHLFVPTGRTKSSIRAYHAQLLEKARQELLANVSSEAFDRRLITGFTLTVNEKELENLKSKLVEFLDSFCREAGALETTAVYQCNVQFFPLTKS